MPTLPPYLLPWNYPPRLLAASLVYAVAYGIGLLLFMGMARRRGLDTGGVRSVAVVGLLGGLIGANIGQFLGGGTLGKTILGGIIGGYLCVVVYKRRIGLRRPLGDLFAVALAGGEAVGRWGCFLGGCCYGKPTSTGLPWAVWQHEAWRHPSQIYLSLASIGILGILLWREFRRPLPENGLFYLQGLLVCVARFGIEFWREGKALALHLTTAQWVCAVGLVFFGWRYAHLPRRERVSEAVLPTAGVKPA